MKVEKSKISEWIKEVKRVTISTGTCACGTGAGEMLEGSRGEMAVLWANDPKLRLVFQEFEDYSEMIRFAVEKAFFSWMIKGHAGGNETSCKANPVILMRNDASLDQDNGKNNRKGDGYEMFRKENLLDVGTDYICELNKREKCRIIKQISLEW